MRYIKVFLLILLFFVVMLLFVQNQPAFSDSVVLKFDPMIMPEFTSMPMPRYALLLICFALGAIVVLAMLLWDRLSLSSRLAASRRRENSLRKQLETLTAEKEKLEAAIKAAEQPAEAK